MLNTDMHIVRQYVGGSIAVEDRYSLGKQVKDDWKSDWTCVLDF